MADELIGASVWERALYHHLTSHADSEQELLDAYKTAADESGSAAFVYLVGIITEDEIRHHRWFEQLALALRTDAEFRSEPPAVPRLEHWGPHPERVLGTTEKLLDQERSDDRHLKQLEKDLRDVKDTSLWHLLVLLMLADTKKHIEILSFVADHSRRATESA
jgi:rubrerythrin